MPGTPRQSSAKLAGPPDRAPISMPFHRLPRNANARTGGNTQPLRILLIRPPEAKERLIAHLSEGNRDKARSAPVVAVLAADTSFHEHMGRLFPQRPQIKDYFAADDDLRERQAK